MGEVMVVFPPEFVATRYPGYFWHLTEQRLYTIKVTGILRPLAVSNHIRYTHGRNQYKLSVNGNKRHIYEDTLKQLKAPKKNQVVPVQK
jgi:hypothetical protein